MVASKIFCCYSMEPRPLENRAKITSRMIRDDPIGNTALNGKNFKMMKVITQRVFE